MDEGRLVLDRRIRKDLETLDQIWSELEVVPRQIESFLEFLGQLDG